MKLAGGGVVVSFAISSVSSDCTDMTTGGYCCCGYGGGYQHGGGPAGLGEGPGKSPSSLLLLKSD